MTRVPEPLLDAWVNSGQLNQMLGHLADKSHRGHPIDDAKLQRIKTLVHEAEQVTADCLRVEKVGEDAGE